jgi:hypothetical protein
MPDTTTQLAAAVIMAASIGLWPGAAPAVVAQESGPDASLTIDGPPPPAPPAVVARDEQGRVTVRAVRIDRPIDLDGRLDDEVYTAVPSIEGFIQQEPQEGQPVTERTEVWVLFDDRNVYISGRLWDSHPDRMVMNEMRRDNGNIFQNESFTVVFDTFYDRRNGFFFQTNPLGAVRDGLVTDERNNNNDWNTVWNTRSSLFDQGWMVEMMIPFKSLRYREAGPHVWGLNIRRGVRWKNEQQFLTPIPASYAFRGIYKFSSAATLVGIEPPANSRNLELKPYGTSALRTDRVATPRLSNDLDGDFGFDAKYGLTRSLIADFTYNTDFAQVEDDDQQVNLTRFNLFFPEKRDFFLEGQGIFGFGGTGSGRAGGGGGGEGQIGAPPLTPVLFFSRRIGLTGGQKVPINAGGRATGRAGPYTLGFLNIQTGENDAVSADSTNFSVVRLRRDILRRSTIGLIGTHRSDLPGVSGSSHSYGVDAYLAFFANVELNAYYARTKTPGRTGDEASYRTFFSYNGDRYGVGYEHLFVGDAFNPEVGFLRRSAFRRNFGQFRFSPRPAKSATIRKFSYDASFDRITNPAGALESREVVASFNIEKQNSDRFDVEHTRSFEFLAEPFAIDRDVTLPVGGYEFHDTVVSYFLGQQRKLSGTIAAARGTFYNGTKTEARYQGRVELGPRLSVEPRISFNWIDLDQGRFTTKLVSSRVTYTMTPRMLTMALLQYNSSNDTLSTNIRFRWEYEPGSDLYVVFTEGRNTDLRGYPDLQNRGVVVKLTRLFRF